MYNDGNDDAEGPKSSTYPDQAQGKSLSFKLGCSNDIGQQTPPKSCHQRNFIANYNAFITTLTRSPKKFQQAHDAKLGTGLHTWSPFAAGKVLSSPWPESQEA
jgi:hypothetical protein